LRPVHMVLAVDLSLSMCETNEAPNEFVCSDPNSKWGQVKSGLDGFFKSPESAGFFASIIPWSGDECKAFNMSITPDTALPDASGTLSATLAKQRPDGGTPTHAAIDGARNYGSTLQKSLKDDGKVITVMVTDGVPMGCSSMPLSVTAATASNAAGFPLYIIGVGSEAANLKSLAVAGGTKEAFNVFATADLLAALKSIRGSALGCNLSLPKAPAGQTLNLQQVNVIYDTGTQKTLPYSQDCAISAGWKYTPSATAPTGIELCATSCDDVRKAPIGTGKLKVVLGCATSTTVK
jgi:hypothetical protein